MPLSPGNSLCPAVARTHRARTPMPPRRGRVQNEDSYAPPFRRQCNRRAVEIPNKIEQIREIRGYEVGRRVPTAETRFPHTPYRRSFRSRRRSATRSVPDRSTRSARRAFFLQSIAQQDEAALEIVFHRWKTERRIEAKFAVGEFGAPVRCHSPSNFQKMRAGMLRIRYSPSTKMASSLL